MSKHADDDQRECCCTLAIDEALEKRRKRNKPHPWIVRKFAVGLTLAIIGFACYVYVDRICVPLVLRKYPEGRGRVLGGECLLASVGC